MQPIYSCCTPNYFHTLFYPAQTKGFISEGYQRSGAGRMLLHLHRSCQPRSWWWSVRPGVCAHLRTRNVQLAAHSVAMTGGPGSRFWSPLLPKISPFVTTSFLQVKILHSTNWQALCQSSALCPGYPSVQAIPCPPQLKGHFLLCLFQKHN